MGVQPYGKGPLLWAGPLAARGHIIVSDVPVVCLFSWRYNLLWLYFHSPVAGFSLFIFEVS